MPETKMEQRTLSAELRAESEGDEFALAGYAALFNSESKPILGVFRETIAPGAFDRALREKQLVRFTFNHSLNAVLARTDNGTLQLSTDAKGLKFRAQLNRRIQLHSDLWEACRSGLYTECSFVFSVPSPSGEKWSPDGKKRTLLDVDLFDCSLVGEPAYNGTSAAARSDNADYFAAVSARLETMRADWARRDKAHELEMRLIAERSK
ncbi:MAG: HK97 family phage prohead protease [Terriglobales bacterium]